MLPECEPTFFASADTILSSDFQVCQTRDDHPLLVGLAGRDKGEDMIGEHLPRLNQLSPVAVLELLESLHRPFYGGWSDGAFEDIDHTERIAQSPVRFQTRAPLGDPSLLRGK
jgi:hypothetical protein